MASDKENEQPETRENTPRPRKARGMRGASARMPTPDSGSTEGHGSKRRRTENYDMASSEPQQDGEDEDDAETPSQPQPEPDDEGYSRYYDPNQDPDERRQLRAGMRDHQRELDGESALEHHGMDTTDAHRQSR